MSKPVSYLHPTKRTCSYRTIIQVRDACNMRHGSLKQERTSAHLYTAQYVDSETGEWVKIKAVPRAELLAWANNQAPLNRPL